MCDARRSRRGNVIGPARSRKIVEMTDLLRADPRRTSPGARGRLSGRSLTVTAVVGGVVAPALTLAVSAAIALAGWFAADAGRYGDTRDAVRVGADAWLLAHGAGLRLEAATVTLLPLGLTFLCAYVAYRVGRWAGAVSSVGDGPEDLRPTLTGIIVNATVYALVALLVSVATSDQSVEPGLLHALGGGFLLALVAGGSGILVGSGQARAVLRRAPDPVRSALLGTAATVLLTVTAASVLVGGALVADFGTAATVLSRLHTDGAGGLMYTVVGILFVPNAVLLGAGYLLGPGFAVGTGTVVSPTVVVLGPVPAFPLLAALPGDGATPGWTTALLGLPVLLALVGVVLGARTVPAVTRFDAAAVQGLVSGVLAAVLLTLLVLLAGGAAGPGRMADVGADAWGTFAAAAVSFGGGGLLGGLAAAARARRRSGVDLP